MRSIKKIVIYSVGLLGGSLASAFKQSGFEGEIVGISSAGAIQDALQIGYIDSGFGYSDIDKAVDGADLIFLCSPIHTIIKSLETLSTVNLPEGVIITDVGSTKHEIIRSAEELLPKSVTFIGGHPMAGSEKSGATAADPFLFQNAVFVLAQSALCNQSDVDEFGVYLEKFLGCRSVVLDPKTHDTIAATVSHVPHIVASAMVNFASEVECDIPGTLNLAAGGFKSLTRIAASPYRMWHDIFSTNKEENLRLLARFIEILEEMHLELKDKTLEVSFDKAAVTRQSLSSNSKGFIGELTQIVVVAEDFPGFLAKMTTTLADANMNIRDIELLKIREGESGTFMLAFSTSNEAEQAIVLLETSGFLARLA